MELTSMAIHNPILADVWPNQVRNDPIVRSQHMYANLLLQHARLQYTTGVDSRAELIANLQYLFASPKVRAFWRDTANSRKSIYVDESEEQDFARLADQIWSRYEEVLACSTPDNRSSTGRKVTADDEERLVTESGATADPSRPQGTSLE